MDIKRCCGIVPSRQFYLPYKHRRLNRLEPAANCSMSVKVAEKAMLSRLSDGLGYRLSA
jgi:hypothetical protein